MRCAWKALTVPCTEHTQVHHSKPPGMAYARSMLSSCICGCGVAAQYCARSTLALQMVRSLVISVVPSLEI